MHVLLLEVGVVMAPEGVYNFTMITDCAGMNVRDGNVALLKRLLALLTVGYPDRMGFALSGPLNTIMRSIMGVLNSWLPGNVRRKVNMFGPSTSDECSPPAFADLLDPEEIPDFFGGPARHDFSRIPCGLSDTTRGNSFVSSGTPCKVRPNDNSPLTASDLTSAANVGDDVSDGDANTSKQAVGCASSALLAPKDLLDHLATGSSQDCVIPSIPAYEDAGSGGAVFHFDSMVDQQRALLARYIANQTPASSRVTSSM